MATVKTFFPSNDFSSVDPKPSAYASVTVTEVEDAESNAYPSDIVSKFNDELPFETSLQKPVTAVTDLPQTRSSSLDFITEVEHLRLSFEILNILEKYGRT